MRITWRSDYLTNPAALPRLDLYSQVHKHWIATVTNQYNVNLLLIKFMHLILTTLH